MLSRIGAALIQFVAPICSPNQQTVVGERNEHKATEYPQPDTTKQKDNGTQTNLTLVSSETPVTSDATNNPLSVAHTFLQIFNLFQGRMGIQARKNGFQAYSHTIKNQKKGSKARRGAMLDESVE